MARPGCRDAYIEVSQKRTSRKGEGYTIVQVIHFELPENEPLTEAHYKQARQRFQVRVGGSTRYPIRFTPLDPKLLRARAKATS